MRSGRIPVVALLLAAGCSPLSVERDEAPPLQTDALEYRLVRDTISDGIAILRTDIPYTFANRTGGAVYLEHCLSTSPSLERETEEGWVLGLEVIGSPCWAPPIEVPPGAIYHDTMRVLAPLPDSDIGPWFEEGAIPGVFRLVWTLAMTAVDSAGHSVGEHLPKALQKSNRFVLR